MKILNNKVCWFIIVPLNLVVILTFGCLLYNNQFYAQKVIKAIEKEDIAQLEKLMESSLGNLNSKPTLWILEVLGEENKQTPLQFACSKGNPEIVKMLLENGADPNYTHWDSLRNNGAALNNAASSLSKDRFEIIKLLIEFGADINYKDNNGNDVLSCLVYAAEYHTDTIQTIEYLEERGANIYKKYSVSQNTLLHKACEKDNISIVEYLVEERNFDVNETDCKGNNSLICLMRSAGNQNEETVLFLLEKGADPYFKNDEGMSAYDYAIQKHPEYVNLLDKQSGDEA